MGKGAKVPVILLIILTLVLLALAGTGFYLYYEEHAKLVKLEERIGELSAKHKITEAKLMEAQGSLSAAEGKLRESSERIEDLTNQLNLEKESKEESVSTLNSLKSQLEEEANLRLSLEEKLKKAQDELAAMDAKFRELELQKNKLEEAAKGPEEKGEGVELGKIVVSPGTPKAEEPLAVVKQAEGKVLVVNKEYNFAVISFGSKDGVNLGDVFSIYSGPDYLGDVKVEKLHDSMSAAGFMSDGIKDRVKEGDRVTKKG